MTNDFYRALKQRRSVYAISNESPISDERIIQIVEYTVLHTPSAFNSQNSRVLVLLGDKHDRFWQITKDALRAVVPADQFASTNAKIDSFSAGYGTILYFEDMAPVRSLQSQFPLYADNFPVWSLQANGMLQHNIWAALSLEGLGASLQHYTELIEDAVKAEWQLPADWKLDAQMPFGKPVADPQEKSFLPVSERVLVLA